MTIGVWGDSITFGSFDSEALGWVGRLRKAYVPDGPGNHLYNFGICGETSADILKRFDVEAEAINPTHIMFAAGTNDAKHPEGTNTNQVSLEEYTSNVQELVARAKKHTENIALVGTIQADDAWRLAQGNKFLNAEMEKYNAALLELSNRNNVLFVPTFDVLDPATDLADGLHPNAQGYQKMFETIGKALKAQSWF